jgi:hypothetical protein
MVVAGCVVGTTTGPPEETTLAVGWESEPARVTCAAATSGRATTIASDPSNNAKLLIFRFMTALSFPNNSHQ